MFSPLDLIVLEECPVSGHVLADPRFGVSEVCNVSLQPHKSFSAKLRSILTERKNSVSAIHVGSGSPIRLEERAECFYILRVFAGIHDIGIHKDAHVFLFRLVHESAEALLLAATREGDGAEVLHERFGI